MSSVRTPKPYNPLHEDTFGKGKAERYLVDTLNELQRPRVNARCMSMISATRAWVNKLQPLSRVDLGLSKSSPLTTGELSAIVRLFKTEQGVLFSKLNAELDETTAAWSSQLDDIGNHKRDLEARALKLAMNIASGAFKGLGDNLYKRQAREVSNASKLASRTKIADALIARRVK